MQSTPIPAGWTIQQNELYLKKTFKTFLGAFEWITKIVALAEEVNHHPRWAQDYTRVEIWITTHDAGNTITEKDIQLATKINQIVD